MNVQTHEELKAKIWEIANRLRGPYRPPQYRLVMLPMVVLRRLDCVLEPTRDAVLKEREALAAKGMPEAAMDRLLGKAADPSRKHPLYNTSPYTFARLLGDAENIAPNLVSYINGFSPTARDIFERFKFAEQIEKLDASNRLFTVVKAMTEVDLHPDRIDNLQMGYLFEHLVMRFNEQANEEAGDHFTPREVIRLMANLIYTGEADVHRPGIYRTIYDPACGTGGMLSESEKLILSQNARAQLALFGQEYNDEAWAICCADMLIKDEGTDRIVLGDTLGDGRTGDGFEDDHFHYLMANPPFGVEWKDQKDIVVREHEAMGFSGRFGAGLPAINDGSLLFLQHMISKMHPYQEGDEDQPGSKIAIVFNGSPLFSGDAGSGPSNIRRWIIENDWLDAIVALPDQLFYNTGIFTYVWLVTNRKPPERRDKVQLIDGTRFFRKMKKSLNNKRNEIAEEQIRHLTRVYGACEDGETAEVAINGETESRVVSRIFENREFGFLKVAVERPLRMNFEATPERIAKLDGQRAFANLATSKKRKDAAMAEGEIAEGRKRQDAIRAVLATLEGNGRYVDREAFGADLTKTAKRVGLKIPGPIRKAIFAALGERDPDAGICRDGKGRPEPDSELRDTENIPLPSGTALPPADGLRAGQAQRPAGRRLPGPHRNLHRPRGAAPCARCLGGLRQDQGRLRNPDQPALLRLQAAAPARRDRGGHHQTGRGDRRTVEGDGGVTVLALPPRWSSKRLKHLATYNDEVLTASTNYEYEIDYVEISGVSLFRGIEEIERVTFGQAPARARRKVRSGDILISTVRTYLRAIAVVHDASPDLIASTGFCVVRPNNDVDSGFLGWIAKSEPFVSEVVARSVGVSYPAINASDLVTIGVPLPPLDTQRRIARFLDEKTARIDGLIEKKRALLDRLAEKRQALITRAVTKGLNPDAPMKSSGIDWLGDVPEHWATGIIRRFATMKTGHTPSRAHPEYWDDCRISWFTLTDVWQLRDGTRWYLGETAEKISEIGLANSAAELLPTGTVVFSRTASVGYSGIMPRPMATTQDFWNWVCGPRLIPEYLLLLFRSMTQKFDESTSGSTHKTVYQGIAAGLRICVAPIDEQKAIASFVFERSAEIDALAKQVRCSMECLCEYRSALITAAVTGRLTELQ